jgi:hypothetical protein
MTVELLFHHEVLQVFVVCPDFELVMNILKEVMSILKIANISSSTQWGATCHLLATVVRVLFQLPSQNCPLQFRMV